MERKVQKLILAFLMPVLLLCGPHLAAQEKSGQRDSLVRLVKGASLQIITKEDGSSWRKAIDATFLHNDTYFICDTAYWNVTQNVVNAIGHVRLTQNGTVLSSELMDYMVNDNLAKFRGGVVQLCDEEGNTLRTYELDYNTADSLAVFTGGGALKDKDGQVIESEDGSYDSKSSLFSFSNNVNMFTDSVFIRTQSLEYHTDINYARFTSSIDFWKEDNMLSARRGWYDRGGETFFFTGAVHGLTEAQESWSDSLYFYRLTNDVLLLGRAQVQDTTRGVSAVAERFYYCDSLSQATMTRQAAVAIEERNEERTDTVYFGADTLIYYTVPRCAVSEGQVKEAEVRLEEILSDPVSAYRKKAAEEAARAAAEAAQKEGGNNLSAGKSANMASAGQRGGGKGADSKDAARKGPGAPPKSQAAEEPVPEEPASEVVDSLTPPPPPDSTKIGFAMGKGHVRVYRDDIQVLADSLRYTDLDSIARFYINPIVWNDGNRQYSADSLFTLIRGGHVERASLLSSAMILTQEDTLFYDQIRGAEVMAYFDSTSALSRFDALGGASTLFYLEENGQISTANKVECEMMSGVMLNGTIDKVYYFSQPKNNAFPLAQMTEADRFLKGFNWQDELRPTGPLSITNLKVRPSQRAEYNAHTKSSFPYTDEFFPGYMKSVYDEIEYNRTHPKKRASKPVESVSNEASAAPDGLAPAADSLSLADSLRAVSTLSDSLALADSLALGDSLAVADTLSTADSVAHVPTKAELRRAAVKAKHDARIAARDARWAELDARDAAKQAEKDAKALERKRRQTLKAVLAQQKNDEREQAILEKYIRKYQRKKDKENADKQPEGEISPLRSDRHPVE